MARKVAAPKSTGGGGSTIEGQVAAWYLLHMLAGIEPFDGKGKIKSIRFQARVADWYIDDLLLELHSPAGSARAAISSKSGTSDGVQKYLPPNELLLDCWEQYLKPGASKFDPSRDVLVLAQGPLTVEERLAVDTAIQAAQNVPLTAIDDEIFVAGFTNEQTRTFFRGFAMPDGLPADVPRPSDPSDARASVLLRAVRVVDFDFELLESDRKARALWMAREMVPQWLRGRRAGALGATTRDGRRMAAATRWNSCRPPGTARRVASAGNCAQGTSELQASLG